MNEPIILSAISAVSGVVIAYIVNVAAKRVNEKKAEKQPKDRMEQMFDGYERLIAQKDAEDDRKGKLIVRLEDTVNALEAELNTTRVLLSETQKDLVESREETEHVRLLLDDMRREYARTKKENI